MIDDKKIIEHLFTRINTIKDLSHKTNIIFTTEVCDLLIHELQSTIEYIELLRENK